MTSNPAYQLAITTHRSSAMLAKVYGHPSVEALAMSLPSAATCLDVGAGASPLGVDVATLRPDIEWHNVDYSYLAEPSILAEVSEGAPPNVCYIPGDITDPDLLTTEYDTVFSYWLWSHLSAHSDTPAQVAAQNVYVAASPDATFQIGPNVQGINNIRTVMSGLPAATFHKDEFDQEPFINAVVDATRLEPLPRMIVGAADRVATPLFGTSRFITDQDGVRQIVHMNTGEYVPVKSLAGAASVARLTLGVAAEVTKQALSNAFDRIDK